MDRGIRRKLGKLTGTTEVRGKIKKEGKKPKAFKT